MTICFLGSARLQRAGFGILPKRTSSFRQSRTEKVRDGDTPSPARCKRALPRTRNSRRAKFSRKTISNQRMLLS